MLLGEIYDLVILKLREDYDRPNYWKEFEVFLYIKIAVNKIITKTNLVLNERSLPLVPNIETGEFVKGVYEVSPILYKNRLDINRIQSISWPYNDGTRNRKQLLKIQRPFEMERVDFDWTDRVCENGEIPTHAILWGGGITDYGDTSGKLIDGYELSAFAKPKIHLYPKPNISDEQLALIKNYSLMIKEFNDSGDSIGIGQEIDYPEDYVTEITSELVDIENDYEGDSGIVAIEQFVQDNILGVLPTILYKPRFDIEYKSDSTSRAAWRAIDMSFLSDDLQLSIVDYVRAEAYDKDGPTASQSKSDKFEGKFNREINDGKAENFAHQNLRKKRDNNYI